LSGLTDDDHPQYLSASDARSGVAQSVKDSLIPSEPVAGGIAYGTATSLDFSAAGTAGQVMTSGGASVPTWTNSTSANTASAIVQRDANGDFAANEITAALVGNADTATTSTHLAGGGANRIAYQTGSGATAFLAEPTTAATYLQWDGDELLWASAGANITDDTSTNATYYPALATANSGSLSAVKVSSTKFSFNPSTGRLTATYMSDAEGDLRSLPLNSQTAAYIVAASDNGKVISITTGGVTVNNSIMSAGNVVTIYNNSGSSQTITQGSGVTLRWAGQSSSTTGNRTLGLYGMATIYFLSASSAVITGSGLT
jgi:hypothetical protein